MTASLDEQGPGVTDGRPLFTSAVDSPVKLWLIWPDAPSVSPSREGPRATEIIHHSP